MTDNINIKKIFGLVLICSGLGIGIVTAMVLYTSQQSQLPLINPLKKGIDQLTEKPLDKYTFENLKKRQFIGNKIVLDKILKDDSLYSSYIFSFTSDGKKISGVANVPKTTGKAAVIVMLRGYADRDSYTQGVGTQHAADVFARAGFITLAPDFLGYGQSASPSADSLEERFETYTTALDLLASVKNLPDAVASISSDHPEVDISKVALWGHSNGGHIALAVLEITGASYPAVLWAPVSKPFPYSILYYTDEFDDHGKKLRKIVADFEKDYDAEKYSLTNYFDWIQAPIQLHQGDADLEVPLRWSDTLYNDVKKLNKDISYFTYPGDDHNFAKGNWSTVVSRNISFYKLKLYR